MITLGITGLMGSGKSFVSKSFAKQGIPVYDTDQKAKDLLNSSISLRYEITQKYGTGCYLNGKWNRDFVVNLASKDETVLSGMGKIIELYLAKDFKEFKDIFSGKDTGYTNKLIAVESAILFKSKLLLAEVDKILVVEAPIDVRIGRIKQRDPFRSDGEIKFLLDKQVMPPFCQIDYIIENDGSKDVDIHVKKIIDEN
jgi:dephospho-CoA kinase